MMLLSHANEIAATQEYIWYWCIKTCSNIYQYFYSMIFDLISGLRDLYIEQSNCYWNLRLDVLLILMWFLGDWILLISTVILQYVIPFDSNESIEWNKI